jgi:lysozyme family protein
MTRTQIFDAFRDFMGGSLTQGEVDRLNAFLDQFRPSDPFDAALGVILRHEGGFVNHRADPGGMTNLGVTRATWEQWTGKPADEAEMRSLTRDKVAPLYRANYWDAVQCDKLPPGLALCVFDFAVNAGPKRAARFLQSLVGRQTDGVIGPLTLAALKGLLVAQGEPVAIQRYQDARAGYYRRLETFDTFGRGWLRRVEEVMAEALEWAV